METPDVTTAQVVALVGAVLDVAAQFGANLSAGQHDALLALFGVLAAIVLGDAHIRNGRARNLAYFDSAARRDEAGESESEGE